MPSLETILTRRSAQTFTGEPPTQGQLDLMIQAAATVPDHGRLRPWRLVVVHPDGRESFGDALVRTGRSLTPELAARSEKKLRDKAFVAPVQIVIVSSPADNDKVPGWEQEACAACVGYAVALAAHAQGLGAVWKTAPFRRGEGLDELLSLGPTEQILGWVNVGVPESLVVARPAFDVTDVVTHVVGARAQD